MAGGKRSIVSEQEKNVSLGCGCFPRSRETKMCSRKSRFGETRGSSVQRHPRIVLQRGSENAGGYFYSARQTATREREPRRGARSSEKAMLGVFHDSLAGSGKEKSSSVLPHRREGRVREHPRCFQKCRRRRLLAPSASLSQPLFLAPSPTPSASLERAIGRGTSTGTQVQGRGRLRQVRTSTLGVRRARRGTHRSAPISL